MSKTQKLIIPVEVVMNKIYYIRNIKVMLDFDLAELYKVENRSLKQAVRRNQDRFPEDFMFELNEKEFEDLRSQIVISKSGGTRYAPMAFTEHGVLMLSSVLKSERATQVNIHIMRVFTKMKEMLLSHKDILLKIEKIERETEGQGAEIKVLFEYLKKLMEDKETRDNQANRKRIGFKKD